ncbi:Peroxiredoxin-like 2A [Mytilus edulis]|uniref:Peroxiredoxin-like 2A n=1 Tax=Mytilus edulis TaxID=6550 RepID=A0A8S3U1M0_MYTED|nr:Peroxiredoxin-like 2A [Mytilus edulis]
MATEKATLQYLQTAKLQTIDQTKNNFSASDLWKDNGVVLMAEAIGLSSLLPELEAHRVQLHAVVHETLGVDEFKPFFKGDVYLDLEKKFYGPKERWTSLFSLLRFGVMKNIYRVKKKSIPGNMIGEGRLLGGVYVIGPGEQGILFQYHEKEFGDHADLKDIMAAVENIKST